MTEMYTRTFPRPWRKIKTPMGFIVVDNEGKKLAHILSHAGKPTFEYPTPGEAEAVADAIVGVPDLLRDLKSARQAPAAPLDPMIALTQASDGKFYIVRDSYGVLISSRPFDTMEAAVYACVVWYGGEPAMPSALTEPDAAAAVSEIA